MVVKVLAGKLSPATIRSGLEAAWSPCTIVKFKEVRNHQDLFKVKILSQEQLEFVLERQPWIIAGHTMQMLQWEDFNKNEAPKFERFCMWFHLGNYPAIYLKVPIIISNLLDTDYFDTQDLKLIEIYEKTKTELAIVHAHACFNVKNPLPLGF